jgi:DNA-binding LacI/PurR family transcriptional regulator
MKKIDRRTILDIAHEAQCDERTVRKVLAKKKPKYVSEQRRRVLDAIEKMLDNRVRTV